MQSIAEIKAFFDERAKGWDSMCSHDPDKLSAIVALSGIKQGDRVLDIATGTGVLLPELLRHEPSAIVAVDLSDSMIEEAKKKLNDNRVRLVASDIMDFFEDGFDIAFLYSAYPHFPHKRALLRHIAARLRAGGRLVVAHSEGKDVINSRHQSGAGEVSNLLLPAVNEQRPFSGLFDLNIMVDTGEFYILSGVKTESFI